MRGRLTQMKAGLPDDDNDILSRWQTWRRWP